MLYAVFDQVISTAFCGSKAIDYFAEIADTICLWIPEEGWSEALIFYEQLFRRLALKASQLHDQEKRLNICLVLESSKKLNTSAAALFSVLDTVRARMRMYQSEANEILGVSKPQIS
jgi:hypothetical protein